MLVRSAAPQPAAAAPATVAPASWEGLPAAQQPQWRDHPAYWRTLNSLVAASPLVSGTEVAALQRSLVGVALGRAMLLQVGDCAESFYECTEGHTVAKLEVLDDLADLLVQSASLPVTRVARIGGQYAKPRSRDTERVGDVELPAFRGHLVNSEVPTPAARQHDPRRMLWAYEASSRVLRRLDRQRQARRTGHRDIDGSGPWASHEALVIDYESSFVQLDLSTGQRLLTSTHFPWIGERTRRADGAHVALAEEVSNPVAVKVGPTATPREVLDLCRRLDPQRIPGRLTLITRMGRDAIEDVLPSIVTVVRRSGHPVIWLCDPMHGNTFRTSDGLKTRRLEDALAEARRFTEILQRRGHNPSGLHLEVAASDVTECIGGVVTDEQALQRRYASLCDPRLNPEQAAELLARWEP